jgi:uncharacterized membrane protein
VLCALVATLLSFSLTLSPGNAPAQAAPTVKGSSDAGANPQNAKADAAKIDEQFVVGKVLMVSPAVMNKNLLNSTGMVSNQELVKIQVLEGTLKDATVTVSNEITDNPAFNVSVKPGQDVVLSVSTVNNKQAEVNIADYYRAPTLLWLLVVFLAAFILFGGKAGLKSLVGLVVTIALIAFVLLPCSLHGFNPLLTAVFICLASIGTSMFFVAGLTKKALASVLGTVGGVIIAGIAAQIVITTAPLTGLSSEEAQILRGSMLNQPPQFYSGLLAAGMLIGALGVIMDVGVSIASAVAEVARTGETLDERELYASGMNVGRDIMGTMTNTLILAYTGGALPLLLLASQVPSVKLLNLDLVATEVASALSGSLGLVCTIPLTAFAAAKLMSAKGKSQDLLHE